MIWQKRTLNMIGEILRKRSRIKFDVASDKFNVDEPNFILHVSFTCHWYINRDFIKFILYLEIDPRYWNTSFASIAREARVLWRQKYINVFHVRVSFVFIYFCEKWKPRAFFLPLNNILKFGIRSRSFNNTFTNVLVF